MVFIFESTSVGIVPLLKGITGQPRVRAGVVVGVLHRGSISELYQISQVSGILRVSQSMSGYLIYLDNSSI